VYGNTGVRSLRILENCQTKRNHESSFSDQGSRSHQAWGMVRSTPGFLVTSKMSKEVPSSLQLLQKTVTLNEFINSTFC
jgi:hypothetical protein